MRMVPVLAGLALACTTAAAQQLSPPSDGQLTARPSKSIALYSGLVGRRTKLDDHAWLYVPKSAKPGHALPLLLLFPGTGGDGRDMITGLKTLAEVGRFAMVGFTPVEENFDAVENFFDDLEARRANARVRWPEPRFGKDVQHIDAVLQRVFASVPVDPSRVGVFGFSHGASYAIILGTANPQLFSSIAAISPGILVLKADRPGGTPVFLAHGRQDKQLPYRRSACSFVPRLTSLGYAVRFRTFDDGHVANGFAIREGVAHFLAMPRGSTIAKRVQFVPKVCELYRRR